MTGVVLIRVDASPRIGAGHLMRMIALAQLLRDDGRDVHLATATEPDALPAASAELTIHRVPPDVRIGSSDDARDLVALARRLGTEWIVLDGYAFETDYQRIVRGAGAKLMSVDDSAACHFVSDVVLNQNYGAEATRYSTELYTEKYLGPRYLMLRREFRVAAPRARTAEPPGSMLVTLGGGAAAAVEALAGLAPVLSEVGAPAMRFRLVAGMLAAVPDHVAALARSRPGRFEVVGRVESMSAEMDRADVAICSGGTTMWELMRMRLPFMAVSLNAPQEAVLSVLERDGLCVDLGPYHALRATDARRIEAFLADPGSRAGMVRRGAAVVDPERSSEAILRIFSSG